VVVEGIVLVSAMILFCLTKKTAKKLKVNGSLVYLVVPERHNWRRCTLQASQVDEETRSIQLWVRQYAMIVAIQ